LKLKHTIYYQSLKIKYSALVISQVFDFIGLISIKFSSACFGIMLCKNNINLNSSLFLQQKIDIYKRFIQISPLDGLYPMEAMLGMVVAPQRKIDDFRHLQLMVIRNFNQV